MSTPRYPGVYVQDIPASTGIQAAPTAVTAFVGRTLRGPVETPTSVTSLAGYYATFGGEPASDLPLAVQLAGFFINGGGEAVIVRLVEPGPDTAAALSEATLLGDRAARTGLYALEKGGGFNILCIPPDLPDGDTPAAVREAAAAYCDERRAMVILDPPMLWQEQFEAGRPHAINQADLGVFPIEAARNAVVYFPRLLVPDPMNGERTMRIPVCGSVAGLWAKSDVEHGVWTAPAGVEVGLRYVAGLAAGLKDADTDRLNSLGINCLRDFPLYGPVVWGARTLAGSEALSDDYKYVSVRRLTQFIVNSITGGAAWTVFEPNGPALWTRLVQEVSVLMNTLWAQGALFGDTPAHASLVLCDASTTTPADIEAGRVNLQVSFAPVRPAEFIVVSLQLAAAAPSD